MSAAKSVQRIAALWISLAVHANIVLSMHLCILPALMLHDMLLPLSCFWEVFVIPGQQIIALYKLFCCLQASSCRSFGSAIELCRAQLPEESGFALCGRFCAAVQSLLAEAGELLLGNFACSMAAEQQYPS